MKLNQLIMELLGKQLVDLANKSDLVRDYLDVPDWKNIVKITHNSVHRFMGFDEEGKAIINAKFVGTRKYKDSITTNQMIRLVEDGAFKHLGKRFGMENYYDSVHTHSLKMGKFAFGSGSFNPDAGTAGNTVDGRVLVSGVDTTWTAVVNHAGTHKSSTGTNDKFVEMDSTATSSQWGSLWRSCFLFDTSSIGAGNTVTDSDFIVTGTVKLDSLSITPDINVYSCNPASDNILTQTDYGTFGSTAFATAITFAGYNAAGTNTFALNSSGKDAVIVDGISKFGLRNANYDVADNAPSWSSVVSSYFQGYYADNGASEPQLDVTYAAAPTGAMFQLF